jgi:hypothetical protein
LGTFTEVRAKTPGPAQPGQAAGAGSGDHKPVAAHYVVLDGSGVLELVISITENESEDWSVGYGKAQFLNGDLDPVTSQPRK